MKFIFLALFIWHSVESRSLNILDVKGETEEWWKTAVIYEIYPRSFQDSNGDGVGDIKGIMNRLEYIKYLGVQAVWLGPMYPSGGVDYGYDVTNMTDIDPLFGSMSDLENLIRTFHNNSIKVIMDYVPNHTSDKHIWFQYSLNNTAHYRDYYVWKDPKGFNADGTPIPPNNWFSVTGGSAWTYVKEKKQYYLHNFFEGQPDLNYYNDDVVREMNDILKFWIDKNVDGFRMDAVAWLCEDPSYKDETPITDPCEDYSCLIHDLTEDTDETYDQVGVFSKALGATKENGRIMFTESYNGDINKIMKYYDYGVTFPMNMKLITDLKYWSSSSDLLNIINKWEHNVHQDDSRWSNWILGNHDQHRVGTRMTPAVVDALNMLGMFLNGTFISYMGEELGMLDAEIRFDQVRDPQGKNAGISGFREAGRDGERSPFQWNSTLSGGFSTTNNTWLPLSTDYWEKNVEAQMNDQRSHLQTYKTMVALRANFTISDKYNVQYLQLDDILTVTRRTKEKSLIGLFINLRSQTYDLSLKNYVPYYSDTMAIIAASRNFDWPENNSVNTHSIILRPGAAVVLKMIDSFDL